MAEQKFISVLLMAPLKYMFYSIDSTTVKLKAFHVTYILPFNLNVFKGFFHQGCKSTGFCRIHWKTDCEVLIHCVEKVTRGP